ncbi:MAG: hypothetical protein HN366_23465 [Deltaproteobacteria bacterium]|jgi:hypothetical protein|nr:hypothetical protein [Deltaproteobacteria bacterium]
MKKIFLFVLLIAMATVAQGADMDDVQGLLGVDGKFTGCFCCVKDTCVVARSEADCKKIGGVKIKNCKECLEAAAPNN